MAHNDHMTNTTCTATDFLAANGVTTLADLPTGQWPIDAGLHVIADVMLTHWTFDGALMIPDRDDLIAALADRAFSVDPSVAQEIIAQ
jgi:hypothetical protein